MKSFTLTLALLSMLGAFSIDTYFPSFPAIADHFGVTLADMQKTLSFYLLAMAVMSLFHGSISDSFGRRRVVLATLAVFFVASFCSIFAPNFEILVVCRIVQGLTAGAGFIITQAVSRDLYKGHEAQQLMAKIMMLFSLAPAIAPVLGGYLHIWLGWQGPFIFLTFLTAALFILSYFNMKETLPMAERQPFHPMALTNNYLKVLGNKQFLLFALSASMCFGGFSVYVTLAPDFVLNILHLKETQFAWLFVPIVIGITTGSFISHRLAGKVAAYKIMLSAFSCMILVNSCNVVYNLFFTATVPYAVIPISLYVMASASVSPVIALQALDLFPKNKGLASSVITFLTMGIFASISGFVAPQVQGSAFAMASFGLFMVVLNAGCLYIAMHFKRKQIAVID